MHDMDPGSMFEKDNDLMIEGCKRGGEGEFYDEDHDLTCLTYWRFLGMVNSSVVRFRNTKFARNAAKAGGAIYTNNLMMITIVPDVNVFLETSVNYALDYVLTKNETHLDACNVSFHKNRIIDNGYGERVATTPFEAFLVNLDKAEHNKKELYRSRSFLSGDRLQFEVAFTDGIGQYVTYAGILTAQISCDEHRTRKARSDCDRLEITGQEIALVNQDGTMSFTDVRLRGLMNQTYVLRVDYSATPELQTLNVKPSYIYVTMRSCIVGEMTVIKQDPYLSCQECSSSTYSIDPEGTECQPCPENAHCESRVIAPDDGYWHASPCSERIQGCLTSHACAFEGRSENLRDMTDDMTSCDVDSAEIDEYQKAQCGKASGSHSQAIQRTSAYAASV